MLSAPMMPRIELTKRPTLNWVEGDMPGFHSRLAKMPMAEAKTPML